MNLPVEGTTLRLRYVAEMRDGSGVVNSGTDVHLKIHDVTADAWWTGAAWGVETELNGTHFAAGAWYYDLALADGLAGHEIEWVWYDEVDGTVVEDGACEVLGAATLVAAETGAQMDLVDAPNATAVAAVQDGLARETTLAAIKGAGWTDETLVAIMAGIEGINPGGAYVVTRRFLDSGGGAVADLKITVQGDDGGDADGTVVAVGTTSATGYVTFNLDAATYHLLSPSTGVWQASDTTVTVAANSSANITVTAQTLPAPSAPDKYVIIINAANEFGSLVGASAWSIKVTRVWPRGLAADNLVQLTEQNPITVEGNGQASFEIAKTTTAFTLEVTPTLADATAGAPEYITVEVDAAQANDDDQIYLSDLMDD